MTITHHYQPPPPPPPHHHHHQHYHHYHPNYLFPSSPSSIDPLEVYHNNYLAIHNRTRQVRTTSDWLCETAIHELSNQTTQTVVLVLTGATFTIRWFHLDRPVHLHRETEKKQKDKTNELIDIYAVLKDRLLRRNNDGDCLT
ncbi:hypothetical protein ElyMa_000495800 [Elysia marginata]|uniref:Uncharacterized protein n=1 Tax=Elysia marginata TaxID=1093978 RepID=A0AAV4FVM6_9GAST|nr:hypothetical protein ElyMa_000495800 [Elysia marginata]